MVSKPFSRIALLSLVVSIPLYAGEDESPRYVGVAKCEICHATDDIGNQVAIWKSSAHARAFESLLTEEAKSIAREWGLTSPPHEAPECLECHVTGYGLDSSRFKYPLVKEDGVQCESCHGPGSEYRKIDIMLDSTLSRANGLILPTEETCAQCHNERSPKFKPFTFEELVKRIEHRVPEGFEWEEEEEEEESLW
ncbi:MAG: multiheme c-type cytochrome [Fidelibacterota bacterium]